MVKKQFADNNLVPARKNAGFTLLELLVMTCLMATVFALLATSKFGNVKAFNAALIEEHKLYVKNYVEDINRAALELANKAELQPGDILTFKAIMDNGLIVPNQLQNPLVVKDTFNNALIIKSNIKTKEVVPEIGKPYATSETEVFGL